ncbi:UNVERIFIED_CONTAM: hypothetical protein FKN15_051377 [Acipenser sinensis]
MPDWYKALLLDAPITPGQTFGPVVDEMLQRSHCAQEFMKELVRLLPKQPPPVCKPAANWHPRSPRVLDADKASLLNVPISPGYTFVPALEVMLQRSHRARESSKQLTELLPRPTYTLCQGQQ